jgi:hypothetical protein
MIDAEKEGFELS